MTNAARLAAAACLGFCLPLAALAQDEKPQPAPAAAPAAAAMPEPASGNPNLSVATVKMDGGMRASKFIGASVTGGGNQELGTVNDLILDKDGHALLGVISVGAVLGVGGKLVAVPFNALSMGQDGKVVLQDGSKDSLAKMPGFTYTQ